MKKQVLFVLTIAFMVSLCTQAQRGVRIGYIDTEYILENVPEYQEATSQLDSKVQKWKMEIEKKLTEIEKKKSDLRNESVLLTNELIKEREEDILIEENEILDYQQKRFGPNGDLMIQKRQLIQPIQDQIFAAVQDLAENKKYDFIFDKSADVVMLFSAERFDMSEQVLRAITRASKRKQAQGRQEKKNAEAEDVVPEVDLELEAKQKEIEETKAARATAVEERKKQILEEREAKKQAALDRRKKLIEEREKAKQEKLNQRDGISNDDEDETLEDNIKLDENTTSEPELEEDGESKTPEQILEERKQQKLKEREERKKALEDKKKKILEEREKARQEKLKAREENKTEENN